AEQIHRRLKTLPGRAFTMGTDSDEGFPADGEGPVRTVTLAPFLIDPHAISNDDFAAFVDATGYRTDAERFGWSFVFHLLVTKTARKRGEVQETPGVRWWLGVERACWKRPEGRGSNTRGRENHPVVHVSHNDATAFCRWARLNLPSEAQWEYAARGGLEQKRYAWGDELTPHGRHQANIWQGTFPTENSGDDGFVGTAPVDTFQPNGFGLYCVAGNVWEWCADWFSPDWHVPERQDTRIDPLGPPRGSARVTRGGSFLCHHSYCNRYRVAARSSNTPDSSTGNTGFRVVATGGATACSEP
ncbi:MAG: formylglycine-generating enzyme family protein, partial [Spirochaeta sp.]|nr:formylglycine-generating enzyme family protein [Spirochaeta sp.]